MNDLTETNKLLTEIRDELRTINERAAQPPAEVDLGAIIDKMNLPPVIAAAAKKTLGGLKDGQ